MYLNVSPYLELLEGIPAALQVNAGIIKLTGHDGVGKSALCQALCALLTARGLHALYFPRAPARVDVLEARIRDRFSLAGGLDFTSQLTRYLQEQSGAQRQLYVIFDNAQDIDEVVFNSIRMLCNIQDEHQALVKPIICGSVALDRKLTDVNYRPVSQHLSQSFTLSPLTLEQLKNFYCAFWQQQGLQVQPPGPTVVNNLFKESQGKPGLVLARLGHAYQRVLDRRQSRGSDQPKTATRRSLRTWLALGLGAVFIGVGAGLVYVLDRMSLDTTPAVQLQAAPAPVVAELVAELAAEQVLAGDPAGESEPVPELATVSEAGMEAPDSFATPQALVATWTSTWQAQDIDGYLAHYHADFEPANGATRPVWEEQRRSSISRAVDIRISYDSVEIVQEDDSSITLQFWLHYSASNYADDTLKELVLLKSDLGLLIRNERNLLVEQPQ